MKAVKRYSFFCLVFCLIIACINDEKDNRPSKGNKEKSGQQDLNIAAILYASNHHDERLGDILWSEGIGECVERMD